MHRRGRPGRGARRQADGLPLHLLQHLRGLPVDRQGGVCGKDALGAGDLLHIIIGELQGDALPVEADELGSAIYAERQQQKNVPQQLKIPHIFLKGDLPPDGFGVLRAIGGHLSLVDAEGEPRDPAPLLSQQADDLLLVLADVPYGADAVCVELLGRPLPDGVESAHVPVDDQVHKVLRAWDLKEAVGLFLLAGGFGGGFGVGHAHGAAQPQLVPDALLDLQADGSCSGEIPGALGHVQIGLVKGDGLQGAGILVPDLMELPRHRLVFLHMRVHVDPLGAAAEGLLDIHGGADAVFARLVAAGRHNAPLVGEGADDQGLSPQRGIVPDLHRGKEGVHIHMKNDLMHVRRPLSLPVSPLYHSRRCFVDSVRRERTLAAVVLLWYPYGKERAGGLKNEG